MRSRDHDGAIIKIHWLVHTSPWWQPESTRGCVPLMWRVALCRGVVALSHGWVGNPPTNKNKNLFSLLMLGYLCVMNICEHAGKVTVWPCRSCLFCASWHVCNLAPEWQEVNLSAKLPSIEMSGKKYT